MTAARSSVISMLVGSLSCTFLLITTGNPQTESNFQASHTFLETHFSTIHESVFLFACRELSMPMQSLALLNFTLGTVDVNDCELLLF